MERAIERKSSRLQTIRRCISVALQQARQSEIENPSKRSFRSLYESGNTPAAQARNTSPGGKDLVTRAGIGLQTFLDCCSEANQRARESEMDVLVRRFYRESRETGSKNRGFQSPEPVGGESGADDQRALHEGEADPSLAMGR